MSIGALALRMALAQELRGRTIAGNAVFDSTIAPIDEFSEGGDTPFISIATEDQKYTEIGGKDLTTCSRRVDLVVEIASGQQAYIETPEGAVSGINLSQTDEAKELTIDMICRQVECAIMRPVHEIWGRVLQGILLKIVEVNVRRGIKAEGGSRLAFRQLVFTVELVTEPRFGEQPTHMWAKFMTALEADTGTQVIAPAIRSVIAGDPLPDHLRDWVTTGMSRDAASGLRLLAADGSLDAHPTLTATEPEGLA